jgi:splicing factor U2AF subunit
LSITEPEKRPREMYVANLPEGLTPNDVTELMNAAMKAISANVKSGDPIVSSWISTEQNFAFLEFRTPEEARNAIKLDGLSVMNKVRIFLSKLAN